MISIGPARSMFAQHGVSFCQAISAVPSLSSREAENAITGGRRCVIGMDLVAFANWTINPQGWVSMDRN
jgi:hypothetical protein